MVDSRHGKDIYVCRGAQTFNNPTKKKKVMAAPAPMRDGSTLATKWDIFDAYKQDEQEQEDKDTDTISAKTKKPTAQQAEAVSDREGGYRGRGCDQVW